MNNHIEGGHVQRSYGRDAVTNKGHLSPPPLSLHMLPRMPDTRVEIKAVVFTRADSPAAERLDAFYNQCRKTSAWSDVNNSYI